MSLLLTKEEELPGLFGSREKKRVGMKESEVDVSTLLVLLFVKLSSATCGLEKLMCWNGTDITVLSA